MIIRIFFCINLFVFLMLSISLKGISKELSYQVNKFQKHIVHILTIDPKKYNLNLIKSHNQVFGRETIVDIANRSNAIAAINAGFFEIGKNEDGRPSGTLVIDGNIFALPKKSRSILQIDNNVIKIRNADFNLKLKLNENIMIPDVVNLFAGARGIALYNHVWGLTTLTSYDRNEIIIDKDYNVIHIVEHGDNPIPKLGWVLSFPKSIKLKDIKIGQKISLEISCNDEKGAKIPWTGSENIVMGIPLLVQNGQMAINLKKTNLSAFITMPHARTAIGVKKDGGIVIVVAEHEYKISLKKLTLEQAKNILKRKQYSNDMINQLTISEMLKTLQKDVLENVPTIGLTLPELALHMIKLGCVDAINLDGGGSSALFFNGKVVNKTIGDEDEGMGESKLRPISDAIIVQKLK